MKHLGSLEREQIQKIQKEGAEETDDAVLHHSGSICDQTLRLNGKNFLKIQEKRGAANPSPSPPKSAPVESTSRSYSARVPSYASFLLSKLPECIISR